MQPYRKKKRDGVTLGKVQSGGNDLTRTLVQVPQIARKSVRLEGSTTLPTFSSYFSGADTAGLPETPIEITSAVAFKTIILSWVLPPEALWRTWEVYEGTEVTFTPDTSTFANRVMVTNQNVVSIRKAVGDIVITYYYKVYAVNSRGERSATALTFGPLTPVRVSNSEIVSLAADKITVGTLSSDVLITSDLTATQIKSGTLDCSLLTVANLDAGSITTGTLTAINIIGAVIKTDTTGARLELSDDVDNSWVKLFTGDASEQAPGLIQAYSGLNAMEEPIYGLKIVAPESTSITGATAQLDMGQENEIAHVGFSSESAAGYAGISVKAYQGASYGGGIIQLTAYTDDPTLTYPIILNASTEVGGSINASGDIHTGGCLYFGTGRIRFDTANSRLLVYDSVTGVEAAVAFMRGAGIADDIKSVPDGSKVAYSGTW